MWTRWLASFPELQLLDLDIGRSQHEERALHGLSPLYRAFLSPDEKPLYECLRFLVDEDALSAEAVAVGESSRGTLLPDMHLLAGAFHLTAGRLSAAVDALEKCQQKEQLPGPSTRRLCPSLRMLLRASPCLLLPLYPNAWSASLMYAVALWLSGSDAAALEVLREMSEQWGISDELRLVAGQIYLKRGELERAVRALNVPGPTTRDALEIGRCLYLAYAHYRGGEYRSAARCLVPPLRLAAHINPHLHARSQLLLAECYERCGLELAALRESGRVKPDEVPGDVAVVMHEREQRWITKLGALSNSEIEQMTRGSLYQASLPDETSAANDVNPLDTTRDPLKGMRPQALSWLRRREEVRQITALRAAADRGEQVAPPKEKPLSQDGQETKLRIAAAQRWWPARSQSLKEAAPSMHLARVDAKDVRHLRFDFSGTRVAPDYQLKGEKRAKLFTAASTAVFLIGLGLWLLRSCVFLF
ncbi:hypothetical protein IIA79_01025 [bacterium]|nr:hypothetical protein [bacterium]